jgi:hypothetical protein
MALPIDYPHPHPHSVNAGFFPINSVTRLLLLFDLAVALFDEP